MTNRFDEHAAEWDAKAYRAKMANMVAEAIRKELTLSKNMSVLDFGCGTGLASLAMAGEVKHLTGLDTSPGMLDVFREKAATMKLDNVSTLLLDLPQGDKLTGTYDLILSSMAFHHVEDVPSLVKVLVSALNPGGYLCIADLDPDKGLFHSDNTDVKHFGFEREEMMGYFKEAGLSKTRATTAFTLERVGTDDVVREFSIFLVTGQA
jgi:tRNA (cmo5U34)-methyltransferase